jgi:hypothetical protein
MAKDPNKPEIKKEEPQITEEVKTKIIDDAKPEIKDELRSEIADDIRQEKEIIKKEAKEEAVQAAKDDLVKTLTGEPKEEQAPWEKEGRRPRDYKEVASWGKDQALKEMKSEQVEKDEEAKKVSAANKKVESNKQKKYDEYWEKQLTELTEEGKIPAPGEDVQRKLDKGQTLTSEDKEDPGMRARAEIFEKARESKETNLRLVYFEHVKDKPESSAGATAPVLGASRASRPVEEKAGYSYEDVHNVPVDDILRGK